MGRQKAWNCSCQKNSEVSSAEIEQMFLSLSQSMKEVVGTVDDLGKKVEGDVKNLEDEMNEGYKNLEEKSVKMEAGFNNRDNARQLVQNEK